MVKQEPDPPPVFGPQVEHMTPHQIDRLPFGALFVRYTEPIPHERIRFTLPCHPAQHATVTTLRPETVVVCRSCSATFRCRPDADPDGGHWANLSLSDDTFVLSKTVNRR